MRKPSRDAVLLAFVAFAAVANAEEFGSRNDLPPLAPPCSGCNYTGTATLRVLGTRHAQSLTVGFDGEGGLWASGHGNSAHTIDFSPCGPLAYAIDAISGGVDELRLSPGWDDTMHCAKRLRPKIRRIRVRWTPPPARAFAGTLPPVAPAELTLTAEVWTVWPVGWKGVTWHLARGPHAHPRAHQRRAAPSAEAF